MTSRSESPGSGMREAPSAVRKAIVDPGRCSTEKIPPTPGEAASATTRPSRSIERKRPLEVLKAQRPAPFSTMPHNVFELASDLGTKTTSDPDVALERSRLSQVISVNSNEANAADAT